MAQSASVHRASDPAARAPALVALLLALLAPGCLRIVVQPLRDAELVARSRTYRATADLRELGVALESYRVERGGYPPATGPAHDVGGVPFVEVATLAPALTGHLRVLASADPWGEPYRYWTSGDAFLLVSLGADRRVTEPTYLADLVAALTTDATPISTTDSRCLEDEIVFAFGRFVRAPAEDARLCSPSARRAR